MIDVGQDDWHGSTVAIDVDPTNLEDEPASERAAAGQAARAVAGTKLRGHLGRDPRSLKVG